MSKNGSTKEFIFSLILQKHPELISSLIGGTYKHLELEKSLQGMYIDMAGIEKERGLPIYIENQMTYSDPIHAKQVLNIINAVEEGIVIWIALDPFVDKYVNHLYDYLNFEIAKPINFYAITFNPDYLNVINQLNALSQIEVWELLEQEKIELPQLKLVEAIDIIPNGYEGQNKEEKVSDCLLTIKGRNKYLLKKLKERMPFLFNLHRSKKLDNRYIIIGAGKSDMDFKLSVDDINGRAFIKLKIAGSHRLPLLKEVEKAVQTSTFLADMEFKYEGNAITYFLNSQLDMPKRIEAMVDSFEKMVRVIAPITYNENLKKAT